MGSEQSQPTSGAAAASSGHSTPQRMNQRPASIATSDSSRLQRGYTISGLPTASDNMNNSQLTDSSPTAPLDSRPTSPPMSVCSDSDLPYISYTDKPIGGRDRKSSVN